SKRWQVVIMEFLDDYELLTLHETTEVKNAIKKVVIKMHNAGFVYSDLRCKNILCRKKQRIDDNNLKS
ncbi:13220_t:CDS:1, partial [Funneliformis geosporum]